MGTRVNQNSQIGGIMRIVVRRESNRTIVHVWAPARPTIATWKRPARSCGAASLSQFGNRDSIPRTWNSYRNRMDAWWRYTAANTTIAQAAKIPGHAEFTRAEETKETPEAVEPRVVLRQVAEMYRKLPAARFEGGATQFPSGRQQRDADAEAAQAAVRGAESPAAGKRAYGRTHHLDCRR